MGMKPEKTETRRGKGFLSRFLRNRSGSTAVEFSLLTIPFAVMVFAILETCISFASQEVMANVADDIARQVRTGQLKPSDLAGNALRDKICDRLKIIVADTCPGLVVDLQNYTSFTDAAKVRTKFTSDGDLDATGFKVDPGLSMSKNMLRVFYKWPVITNFMVSRVSNLKGGKTLHFASVTWQNEPFDD